MIATLLIVALSSLLLLHLLLKIIERGQVVFAISVSFVLGNAIWTFVLFLANLLGLKYTLANAFLVYFILFLVSFIFSYFIHEKAQINFNFMKLLKQTRVVFKNDWKLIGVITVLVGSSLILNMYWPVKDWDSLVMYDFRGKMFADYGNFTDVLMQSYYTSYPLMTSLSHTLVYFINSHSSPMLLYFSYYISLLVIFYYSLREWGLKKKSLLLWTVFLAGTGIIFEQSQEAYTNLLYALFLFAGYSFGMLWFKKQRIEFLVISALFTGLTGWIRFAEPFWIVISIVVVFMVIAKKKYIYAPVYILFVYALRYPWSYFAEKITGSSSSVGARLTQSLPQAGVGLTFTHLFAIVDYLYKYIFTEYGILLLSYFGLVYFTFIYLRKNFENIFLFDLLVILGLVASISFGTYLFSLYQETWLNIGDSARRMSMVLVPFLLFGSARLFSKITN